MADRRFFGRAWASLGSTRNVFGKLCLLALLQFVPVLGQIVTFGYFLGWAREAAWGMETPMPAHVLSGGDRHFWPRGAKAWVTSILYGLIISALIVGLVAVWLLWGHWQPGLLDDVILGALVAVGTAGTILLVVIYYMGLVRLSIYNRFGAAWQWGACLRMAGSDFGGLIKLFFGTLGLYLLVSALVGLIVGLVGLLLSVSIAWSAFTGILGSFGDAQSFAYTLLTLVGSLVVALPVVLVVAFLVEIPYLVISAVCWRALGNWAAGLNVPAWGAMGDPLPAPVAAGASAGASGGCGAGAAATSEATNADAGSSADAGSPSGGATAASETPVGTAPADAAVAGGVTAPTAASEAPAVPAEAPAADAIAPSGVSDASAAAAIGQASAPAAATQALQAGGAPSQASTPAPAAQMLQAGAPSPRPARRSHPAAVIVLCLVGMLVGSLLVCLLVSCVSWGGAHVRHGVSYVSLDASLTDQSVAEGAWRSGDGQTVTFKGDRTFTWEYDRSGDSYVTGTYAIEDLGSEVPESLSDLLAGTGLDELLDAAAGVGIDPSLFGVGVYELRLTADGGASDGLDASLDVKGNTLDVLLVVSGDRALLVDLGSLEANGVQGAILEVERS